MAYKSIVHARYAARIKTEYQTTFTPTSGPVVVSGWTPSGGVTIGPTSTFGRWYTAQYERSRELTPPVDDAARVCYNVGSSSFNSAGSTVYDIRWTLQTTLIACTIEYALRTRNHTTGAFTYGSFTSTTVDSTTPQVIINLPLPAVANDSTAYMYRFCFRPFSDHTT